MEENYIIVSDLDNLTHTYLNEGQNGICYRVNDEVFKKFKNKPNFLFFLKALANIKSKSVIMPNTFVYLNEHNDKNMQGYMMDYVEGQRIESLDELTDIKEFVLKLDKLEKEIKDLTTEYSLLVRDIHPNNVIYTPNHDFKLIDCDSDTLNTADDAYTNYRINMSELGNCILRLILCNGEYITDKVNDLYTMCIMRGKCKPSIVLEEAIKEIETYLKEEITTLKDFNKGISLMLKK